MRKHLALGIAGVTAALIGGFKTVRQLGGRGDEMDPVAVSPGMPAEASTGKPVSKSPLDKDGKQVRTPSTLPSKKSSKAELYEIAQELDIDGRSKMSKDELLKAIEKAN